MAFNSNQGKIQYTASSGQTVFPFNFKVFTDADLEVYNTPSGSTPNDTNDILVLSTDYTVTIDGDNGGSITLLSGATINDTITIFRSLDINRNIEYQTNGDLLADTINSDQDYQTYLISDEELSGSVHLTLPKTTLEDVDSTIPAPIPLKYLRWDITGKKFENVSSSVDVTDSDTFVVPTVDDLSLIDFTVINTVVVSDTERGGIFKYDASEVLNDNQGTNFNGWIRQYSGHINVKWFGAVGDGVVDDTTAITNAINSSNSIYFPDGDYRVTSTITSLQGKQGIKLFGAGAGDNRLNEGYTSPTTISYYGNDELFSLDNAGTGNNRTNLIVFEDLAIRDNGTGTNTIGFYIEDSTTNFHGLIQFNNVNIFSFEYGIKTDYVGWVKLNNSNIQYCGKWAIYGRVNVFSAYQSQIYQNGTLDGDRLDIDGNNSGGGIWLYDSAAVSIHGVDLENNAIGLKLTGNCQASIIGCYFENHTHMAALIKQGVATFSGCYSNNTFDVTYQDIFAIDNSKVNFESSKNITAVHIGVTPIEHISSSISIKYISSAGRSDWSTANEEELFADSFDEKYIANPKVYYGDFLDISQITWNVTSGTETQNEQIYYNPLSRNSKEYNFTADNGYVRTKVGNASSIGDYYSVSVLLKDTGTNYITAKFLDVGDSSVCANGGSFGLTFDENGLCHLKFYIRINENTSGNVYLYLYPGGEGSTNGESIEILGAHFSLDYKDFTLPTSGNMYALAVPTNGYFDIGSRVWHRLPAAGGNIGWICTAAGTPGTWKTFGVISA